MLWVAFYLFSSVDWTVKLFEGYYFPSTIQASLQSLFRFFHFDFAAPSYEEFLKLPQKKNYTKQELEHIRKIRLKAIEELQGLEIASPLDAQYILSTRLGNVLRASEIYAFERYCIEGITIWPRLFNVLPTQFVKNLEEKNNHLLFLLNSSLLAFFNAFLCVLFGAGGLTYQAITGIHFGNIPYIEQPFFARGFAFILPFEYVMIGLILAGFAYGLYSVGVNAAEDYTLFIRSGFDLYRMDLLKQLNQPLPKDLQDEKQTWMTLTEYFIAANRLGREEINYSYVYRYDDGKEKVKEETNIEE